MTKKINLFNVIYFISFYAILFCILFLKWYSNKSPDKFIFIITIFLMVLNVVKLKNSKTFIKKNLRQLFWIIILILYILLNILFTNNNDYALSYIIDFTLIPFLCLNFICMPRINENKKLEQRILNSLFWILNIYNIINFFIILKQISTPGFMVRNFTNNSLYYDMIAGFIGANGIHKLTFLYLITLFLNYYYFDDKNKRKKVIAKICFLFTLVTSLYVSNFNDNRTYYFILVLYMLPLFIKYLKSNFFQKNINKKKMLKGFIFLALLISILNLSYHFIVPFKTFIDDTIISNVDRTFNNFSRTANKSAGGEERLELLKYALNEGNGYTFGKGIGIIPVTGTGLGMISEHFGLNDCNVRIYSGGIVFLLLIVVIYANKIQSMFYSKSKIYYIFIILTLLVNSFYTQSFSYCDKTFLISLVYFLMSTISNKEQLKNEEVI